MPQESDIQNFNEAFSQALALQQQKNWDESLAAYHKLLDQSLNHLSDQQASAVYHNMSTIASEKADLLKAYVWSKKALNLDPNNAVAKQSFEYFAQKFELPHISHQISNYDNFKKLISIAPLDAWLVVTLILILTTLAWTVKKFVIAKKNKLNDIFQSTSKWPVYVLSIISACLVLVSVLRYSDSRVSRAIVITEKAAIQTAPGENKPVIYEAQAGLELEVLKFSDGYFQVRYPGAFSGWVNQLQIELLSLRFEQEN
jgi:tetratricopeptide (TPR) repeat protein